MNQVASYSNLLGLKYGAAKEISFVVFI
jgi:hypothetical protein